MYLIVESIDGMRRMKIRRIIGRPFNYLIEKREEISSPPLRQIEYIWGGVSLSFHSSLEEERGTRMGIYQIEERQ